MYFLDLTFNQVQQYVYIVIQIALLFFLLKAYRDNSMHGQITYGQSVGAGVVMSLYSAIIGAIFLYILYTVIDSGLTEKQLAFVEEKMLEKGAPQEAIDAGMAIQRKIMKPEIMAPFSILGGMFWGTILSLIISIFIKREGNPLIDTPANQQ
jgi:amino acid transporter